MGTQSRPQSGGTENLKLQQPCHFYRQHKPATGMITSRAIGLPSDALNCIYHNCR